MRRQGRLTYGPVQELVLLQSRPGCVSFDQPNSLVNPGRTYMDSVVYHLQ